MLKIETPAHAYGRIEIVMEEEKQEMNVGATSVSNLRERVIAVTICLRKAGGWWLVGVFVCGWD